jgi:hypothetical protein
MADLWLDLTKYWRNITKGCHPSEWMQQFPARFRSDFVAAKQAILCVLQSILFNERNRTAFSDGTFQSLLEWRDNFNELARFHEPDGDYLDDLRGLAFKTQREVMFAYNEILQILTGLDTGLQNGVAGMLILPMVPRNIMYLCGVYRWHSRTTIQHYARLHEYQEREFSLGSRIFRCVVIREVYEGVIDALFSQHPYIECIIMVICYMSKSMVFIPRKPCLGLFGYVSNQTFKLFVRHVPGKVANDGDWNKWQCFLRNGKVPKFWHRLICTPKPFAMQDLEDKKMISDEIDRFWCVEMRTTDAFSKIGYHEKTPEQRELILREAFIRVVDHLQKTFTLRDSHLSTIMGKIKEKLC